MLKLLMVEHRSADRKDPHRHLSAGLKLVRSVRRMRARDVAEGMGIPLRSYYAFEAGEGPLDVAKIWRFAEATDSDPMALYLSLVLGNADLALRCIDNKAASIMLASLRAFDERVGDRATHLGAGQLIEAFKRAFDQLEGQLDKRDESTERWLAENLYRGPSR